VPQILGKTNFFNGRKKKFQIKKNTVAPGEPHEHAGFHISKSKNGLGLFGDKSPF